MLTVRVGTYCPICHRVIGIYRSNNGQVKYVYHDNQAGTACKGGGTPVTVDRPTPAERPEVENVRVALSLLSPAERQMMSLEVLKEQRCQQCKTPLKGDEQIRNYCVACAQEIEDAEAACR